MENHPAAHWNPDTETLPLEAAQEALRLALPLAPDAELFVLADGLWQELDGAEGDVEGYGVYCAGGTWWLWPIDEIDEEADPQAPAAPKGWVWIVAGR